MNLTFQQLVNEFIEGATSGVSGGGGANLKIIGNMLYHFGTTIAERNKEEFVVNITRYSIETTRLQKILLNTIPSEKCVEVKNYPMGYKSSLMIEGEKS